MPDSRAPYIIICNGRIEVEASKKPEEKIRAASNAAMNLTSYYGERCTAAQTTPISDLQHQMMGNLNRWNTLEVNAAITQMFDLLDELEDAMAEDA